MVPDWLRFVKGVIDSENIPIHISRENMQDSTLVKQLRETVMMKCVDFLKRQSVKDTDKYMRWYNEYCGFVKEGVCSDYKNRSRIARLLRYETNHTAADASDGAKISLDDYMDRRDAAEAAAGGGDRKEKANDGEIYYLLAPNRAAALKSPYLEAFQDSNVEVLFCYAQIDEFCMKNLGSYRSNEIVGIESSTAVRTAAGVADETLTEEECRRLCKWLKKTFPLRVEKAEMTERLKTHPAVIVDHQSAAIRSYLQALGEDVKTPPQRMQVNPRHRVIRGLYALIDSDEDKAWLIGMQLINNAFVAAGVMDDVRDMLPDVSRVMEMALGFEVDAAAVKEQRARAREKKSDEQLQEMVEQEKKLLAQEGKTVKEG